MKQMQQLTRTGESLRSIAESDKTFDAQMTAKMSGSTKGVGNHKKNTESRDLRDVLTPNITQYLPKQD